MSFKSLQFKLAVINELLEFGFFQEELAALRTQYWSEDNWEHQPIPEILDFFENLEISEEQLAGIKSICFDGGNDIYFHLVPNWDGEDDYFNIDSIEDAVKLPNLETYLEISMVFVKDHSPLLELPHLKKAYFVSDEPELKEKLMAKGISLEFK